VALKAAKQIVLCDASPLIFLAKLNRLDLVEGVTQARPVVLQAVVDEVLSQRAAPVEAERLRSWLADVEKVDYQGSLFESLALSQSDQASLAWAFEHSADWFLVDERLLRRFAKERGIPVIGFCGLLLRATECGILSRSEVQALLDLSIREHDFRISMQLYQHIRQLLES
jgi:predicted nucleic acid-binding protein